MINLHRFLQTRARSLSKCSLAVALLLGMASAVTARAQVAPAADAGGLLLSGGGTVSGFQLQYGQMKILGGSAFLDADIRRHAGIEAEGRWLFLHQTANVHDATYMIGPRAFWDVGRFQPYAKGLVGFAQFNFPYHYATGSYLAIAPGGGVDFRINHRIRLRLVDVEYQYWPQFTYGGFSAIGVSSGVRFRIF